MIHTTKPISPLRQRMIEDMQLRKLSPQTQAAYIRAVIKLTRFLGHSPDTAMAEDLRRYQIHLVETGISSIMLNATITAPMTTRAVPALMILIVLPPRR